MNRPIAILTLAASLWLPIGARAEVPEASTPAPEASALSSKRPTGRALRFDWSPKTFWAETAALSLTNALDGWQTVKRTGPGRGAGYGNWQETESAWLLGRHPSGPRYALSMGAMQAGHMLVAWKLQHNRRRWVRFAGHAVMLWATADHAQGIASSMTQKPIPTIINPTWSVGPFLPARPVSCSGFCQ